VVSGLSDSVDRDERKRSLLGRIDEMKRQHRDKQLEYRKAIKEEYDAIRKLPIEERQERERALQDRLKEMKQLHFEQQAREEHIRKHHSKDLGSLPDYGDTEVRKGFLKLHILGVLAEGPSHGYEIMHRIGHHTGHMWRPSPGSMYPALETLESNGYVTCLGDGRRKVYSLTLKGQNVLGQIRKKRDEQFLEMKAFMSALFDE
jgi:DNA-binding PadR family transcriptional regulator